ncbi:MAG: polysaccharide deacetylase family protein [Ignavibacteria bacterium]|nr:polysaccharide deacetylase family protein [Ignavibacteria bacterium]
MKKNISKITTVNMKQIIVILALVFIFLALNNNAYAQKPCVSFSFDDGSTKDKLTFKNSEWNSMIRRQLKDNQLHAVWFVAGSIMDSEEGKQLLQKWDEDGHIIANHTYNHFNYNDTLMTCEKFVKDIQKCDSLISGYKNFKRIFRFPYLKGGNTIAKRDSINSYLKLTSYKQGWVTIDASDWYINMRLMDRLEQNPDVDITGFREYYINHIFERAQYYNNLSTQINNRQIKHTVLLHFNLTSALFLNDLIEKFKSEGWLIDDYIEAIKDTIYSEEPNAIPSEQSLIWMQAFQKGGFELRYPGEDSKFEKDKMDKLGL